MLSLASHRLLKFFLNGNLYILFDSFFSCHFAHFQVWSNLWSNILLISKNMKEEVGFMYNGAAFRRCFRKVINLVLQKKGRNFWFWLPEIHKIDLSKIKEDKMKNYFFESFLSLFCNYCLLLFFIFFRLSIFTAKKKFVIQSFNYVF